MLLTPVERVDASSIDDFDRQFAADGRPVIIVGSLAAAASQRRWTLAELVAEFGQVKVPVRQTDDEFREFFMAPSPSPAAAGARRTMMDLVAYVGTIERAAAAGTRPPYAGNISLLNDPAVAHKFDRLLATCPFPAWEPGRCTTEYRLWIGAGGQRSTIHNDPYHNFNAQIVGRKRFILFDPAQHAVLSPVYFHRGMWASPIDPLAPDLPRFPNFARARGFDCTLAEGEVLYVPRFWWHYVQAVTTSVNVNRWVVAVEEANDWWHQQRAARPFVSYELLLRQERGRFAALPAAAQAARREEFQAFEADLLRLLAERSAAAPAESTTVPARSGAAEHL